MRVKLIPTGRCELIGLPECLGRLFPDHTFEAVPARVDPDGTQLPFDGFTSGRLTSTLMPGNLLRLVQQLASEVHPGRDGNAADLAVLIDDLELENIDQPGLVVERVRSAVRQHLDQLGQRENAAKVAHVREALLERASFHLASPMIEAWFFGDLEALKHAGIPDDRLPPQLRAGIDLEHFETDHEAFSSDDGTHCTAMHASARRGSPPRPRWMLKARPDLPHYQRERHPKAYLTWLCRNAEEKRCCSTYRETHEGAAALRALRWEQVLQTPGHGRFARALLRDLADILGPPTVALTDGEEHPLLSRSNAPMDRVLRNL
ncbi:hypothetical protein [Chondromyces crocatus]|uniref:Uncharacterized protein n=1 Tax=Chondromyces crocatus TaxID=52 RepID=A0A0K1EKJ8_CHOCO|nr:hypothetical protein [Chondromyces crocatus]AKT41399.1 uncharacterized protein CMC5_055990 [Chondromyces crocatus]